MSAAEPAPQFARPAAVLLVEEARARGFLTREGKGNTSSFRRWCQRMGIEIRKTGRKEWIATADVDRAVLGAPPPANDLATLAMQSARRTIVAGAKR